MVSFATTMCRKQVLLRRQLCRHKKMILVSPAQKNIISGNNTERPELANICIINFLPQMS